MKVRLGVSTNALAAALVAAGLLAGCGGGDTAPAAPAAPPAAPASSSAFGTMTKSGSDIVVNGVAYSTSASTAVSVDGSASSVAALGDGMVVRVQANPGARPLATRIEALAEVRARVTSMASSSSFTAGGTQVAVNPSTVLANLGAGIAVGAIVEVHGLRDAAGMVRATRVDGRPAGAGEPDKLRGAISALDAAAKTFKIGAATVKYGDAMLLPPIAAAGALANGKMVWVHGTFDAAGTTLTAVRVFLEDFKDFLPKPGDSDDVEGFVTELDKVAKTFKVSGQAVRYGADTEFRNGTVDDLLLNVLVEVEGKLDGATLVAEEVKFKSARLILSGVPSAVNVAAKTLVLFGKTIEVDDTTMIRVRTAAGADSTSLADIVAGTDRIVVHAAQEGTAIVALLILEVGADVFGGRDVVQARVTAENEATFTVTLLGTINAALANAMFEDADGAVITRAQFFTAVVPASATNAGTLIKVKGTFAGGTLTADEAELAD